MNDFRAQNAWSIQSSDEPFWDKIYKKAFPDFAGSMLPNAGKSLSQNLGIDRIVHLKSGKTLQIDEKKRAVKYNDILLEFWSNDSQPIHDGWMNKQLHIDYLAYAFMPTKEVYLFDWQTLRRAWLDNGRVWFAQYPIKKAKNKYYYTHSLAVPINIIIQACGNAINIKL